MEPASRPGGNSPKASHVRNMAGGIIGNVIEWYDFALFGFLAPVLSKLFFPEDNELAGLIKTYGIFAAGYVMRPLGGVLFGHIGDRIGRKRALELSVVMMVIPTVVLGLMPTVATIGLWAPIALVALRLVQGLSVGGELIGSYIFLAEIAPPGRRGLYCSSGGTGVMLGLLLGSAAAAALDGFMDPESVLEFAWRIPFLAGLLLGIAGLWIRSGMTESQIFVEHQQEQKRERAPIVEVLHEQGRTVAHLFMASVLFAAGFYVVFMWLPTYLSTIMDPPERQAELFNTIAMMVLMGCLPLAGALSDRFGRRRILVIGSLSFVVLSLPFFIGLHSGLWWAVLAIQIAFALMMSLVQGTIPATMIEMFETRIRYTGVALGYNIVFAVFGGTAPLVCTWLLQETGQHLAPAYYIIGVGFVSLVATLFLRTRISRTADLRS